MQIGLYVLQMSGIKKWPHFLGHPVVRL